MALDAVLIRLAGRRKRPRARMADKARVRRMPISSTPFLFIAHTLVRAAVAVEQQAVERQVVRLPTLPLSTPAQPLKRHRRRSRTVSALWSTVLACLLGAVAWLATRAWDCKVCRMVPMVLTLHAVLLHLQRSGSRSRTQVRRLRAASAQAAWAHVASGARRGRAQATSGQDTWMRWWPQSVLSREPWRRACIS